MWVGRPPWDAIVGTEDEDGKGTNGGGCDGMDLIARNGVENAHWVVPVNCQFKEGKESRNAIQVHDGTSKMIMKFTTLGVVHDEEHAEENKEKERGGASLSQTRRKEEKLKTPNPQKKIKNKEEYPSAATSS